MWNRELWNVMMEYVVSVCFTSNVLIRDSDETLNNKPLAARLQLTSQCPHHQSWYIIWCGAGSLRFRDHPPLRYSFNFFNDILTLAPGSNETPSLRRLTLFCIRLRK